MTDMLSAEEQEEYNSFLEMYVGWFQCPYCGKLNRELVECCGEIHGEELQYTAHWGE